jgi:hypothetical protein
MFDTQNALGRQLAMGKNLLTFGKVVAWIACVLGGFASFLSWLEIKPKDLAMNQSIPVPHVLWLLLALALFGVAIGSAVWSGIIQRRQIKQLQNAVAMPPPIGREGVSGTSPAVVEEPQYRLKIHSALYGSGKTFKPVDQFLRKKATDALSARVDANLFDAYDPTPRFEKDLTVVYSFGDEAECTIERHEDDWLALPDDPEFRFTGLQRRVMKLARELRKLTLDSPPPSQVDHAMLPEESTAHMLKYSEWNSRLAYCYDHDFAEKILQVKNDIGRKNPSLAAKIRPVPGASPPPSMFPDLAKVLWDLAWEIEGMQSEKKGI